jgi:L-threonylcarbamoyladenylate synthase
MKTLVLRVDVDKPDADEIRRAAGFIKRGGLVAFPTETVYGLGADAFNADAVRALFEAKKRPLDNPPIVHVSDVKGVRRLVREVPSGAEVLMDEFWPGPLTLVFRRSDIVPSVTVAGLSSIAVRMPRHEVALALIRESGCPVAAPSANLAGRPSPTSAGHVLDDLDGRIDAVLDAGSTVIGVESTVLDLTVWPPMVLRPGGTSFEALKKVLPVVELSPGVLAEELLSVGGVRSPGVKYKHYAPKADVVVVEGELGRVVERVVGLVEVYKREERRVGVLCTDETEACYEGADVVLSLGSRSDLAGVARRLFGLLREFDCEKVDVVVAEGLPVEGIGLAVVNRLRKAAGYRIIKV